MDQAPSSIAYEGSAVEQTIAARFEQQARRYPGHIAIRTNEASLRYDALNAWADRIAKSIRDHCTERSVPVVVLADMTASTIAAMLGVWKAGQIYAPLDVASMLPKGEDLLDTIQPCAILASSATKGLARALAKGAAPVLNVDAPSSEDSGISDLLPGDAGNPAILLYTSGSTGEPKVIVQNHRNSLHHVMVTTNACQISALDKVSLVRPPSFVGGVMNSLTALMNGAALVAFDVREQDIGKMAAWLRREQISFFHLGPNLYRHLLATVGDDQKFPDLRLIRLSGEPVTRKDVEDYKRCFADSCVLMNALSSTEAITYRQFFVSKNTTITGEHVPAGYAVPDLEVALVDEAGQRVEPGAVGEIVITSRYLFPGFWHDPQSTRTALVPVCEGSEIRTYHTGDLGRMDGDGCLEHIGRKDFRVKIRGFSVDTARVEAALLNIAGVKQAAVVILEESDGSKRLVAHVAANQGVSLKTAELRRNVAEQLPNYCVPSKFMLHDTLPVTSNGKIDRGALSAAQRPRRELEGPLEPPTNPVEEALVTIWMNVLSVKELGIHDPFLELGGDSLLASKLVFELNEIFGTSLPVAILYDAPSVAELARTLTKYEQTPARTEKIARAFLEIERMNNDVFRTTLARERRQRGNAT